MTHEEQCLCSTSEQLLSMLLDYPDGSCNNPCPGANREFCGGNILFDSALPTSSASGPGKRQNSDLTLVSVYKNTLLLGSGSGSGSGPDSTTTSTITSGTSTTTATASFPNNAISYNITGTNTATVISTTYVDICNVCPGGLTTRSTTITVPHCGCTESYDPHLKTTVAVPSPAVPMITTIKSCGACGYGGVQSTITITVPHSQSIQQLEAVAISPMNIAAVNTPAPTAAAHNPAPAAAQVIPHEAATPQPSNNMASHSANPQNAATAQIMTTPTSVPDVDVAAMPVDINGNMNADAAAPASPPSIAIVGNSATGMSGNLSSMANSGMHGNVTLPLNPVQSFTSSASRVEVLGASLWAAVSGEMRFVFSAGVAVVVVVACVGVW